MVLTEAQLRELSQLADTLQRLPESARADWLANLGPGQAVFRPALRRLLAADDSPETRDFLATLPKLGEDPEVESSGLAAGDEIGPFRLLRELGRGGMGTVWLAERSDGTLKRTVALKLPHSAFPQRRLAERFARERDILAALAHPNIARLYDAGVTPQGQPYLALEYVEGESLLSYCDGRRMGLRERIELLSQALTAVQHAHGQLIVHRDLKPSNILVTAQGEVRLLDFGIAKLLTDGATQETELTQFGGRALTPQYASPEQITGGPIGTASDVYALGVILYEMLTGVMPYRVTRESRGALEDAILTAEPIRPSQAVGDPGPAAARATTAARLRRDLKGDLDTIALKALKKNPADRYATVDAFAADLRRFLAGEPVQARPDSLAYRGRKFIGRHRWAVGVAMVGIVTLTAFTASLNDQVRKVTRERDRADRLAQFMGQIFKVASPSEARSASVTARELLDKAAGNIESDLTDDPEMQARLVRTMGRAYTDLGALGRAEDLLRREYDRARAKIGPDDPATLAVGAELVWLLAAKQQPAPAEAMGRDVLARQRRVLGLENRETILTESHLANALAMMGQFDEAIALQRHSLEVSRRDGKPDDLGVLDEEASMAYYMLRLGKADPRETERLFRDLVARFREQLGRGNLRTLRVVNGLAVVLNRQGRFDEEALLLREDLDEARRTLGPEHPLVVGLMDNLAAALIAKGDLAGAEPILRESLAISTRVNGAESPMAATAKYNLACLVARRGDKDGALALLADALDHGLVADAALQMDSESDLDSLHGDPRFDALVVVARGRYVKAPDAKAK